MRTVFVAATAILACAAAAACNRDGATSIRPDDAKSRRADDVPPLPAPTPRRWDLREGQIVLALRLDEKGRVSVHGDLLADDDALAEVAREAQTHGRVTAEITSVARTPYPAVVRTLQVVTKAGISSITIKSESGPAALVIGGDAGSIVIGDGGKTGR